MKEQRRWSLREEGGGICWSEEGSSLQISDGSRGLGNTRGIKEMNILELILKNSS